ncbi:unnamed protein product [Lactuca saligna]|uniref:Uncharacterized protein n=1 Tax=Lactuca saligna TaxID=75948 RepID=A0AA35YG99_LACSI|nr:unnamed protein product [Lactuca saligna]
MRSPSIFWPILLWYQSVERNLDPHNPSNRHPLLSFFFQSIGNPLHSSTSLIVTISSSHLHGISSSCTHSDQHQELHPHCLGDGKRTLHLVYTARSKLILEETRKANQHSAAIALTADSTSATPPPVTTTVHVQVQSSQSREWVDSYQQNRTGNHGYSDHYGRGRNASRGGRGRGCGRNFSSYNYGYNKLHPQP